MRLPHLAHRPAAAHKLHSTTATTRYEFDSGKGETFSRPTSLGLFSPEAVQTTGTVADDPRRHGALPGIIEVAIEAPGTRYVVMTNVAWPESVAEPRFSVKLSDLY